MIPQLLTTLTMLSAPDSTLFQRSFDEPLDFEAVWQLEGTGRAWVNDGALHLREDTNGVGVVLWLRQEWPDTVSLSFEVSFSNNRGIGVFFIAANGPEAGRTGDYDEYIRGELDSYSFSFHRYWPDGRNNPGANARRNAGFELMSQAMPDPMLESGRTYAVNIAKSGGHIVVTVDGETAHDFVDDGAHGPPHTSGRIGFRLRGDQTCVMTLDNVVVRDPRSPTQSGEEG